ncbi:MAG: VCBS repeat-containing protein, partial [Gemmataceae bacterium]|nr:VCBS repeat-containing protein [Gemmataceae bacterium]
NGAAGFGGGRAAGTGTARVGGGGAGMGGAVFNQGGTVLLFNSTFARNTARGGSTVGVSHGGSPVFGGLGGGYGGAVFNLNGTVVVLGGGMSRNAANAGSFGPSFTGEPGEGVGPDVFNLSLNAGPEAPAGPATVLTPADIPGRAVVPPGVVNRPVGGPATSSTALADVPRGILRLAPASPLDAGRVGTPYSVRLGVNEGPAGPGRGPGYFWLDGGVLPPGLTLGPDGALSGTPTTIGVYSFTVGAVGLGTPAGGAGGPALVRDAATYLMVVGPRGTDIRADGPLAAAAGVPINPVAFTAVVDPAVPGASFPIRLATGSLPPGLSLGADGRLTGTPTAEGTYRFTLEFSSALPLVAGSREFTLTVGAAPETGIRPLGPLTGKVDTPFGGVRFEAVITPPEAGRAGPLAVTAGSLPPGLSLGADGRLTGTPTKAGEFEFTLAWAWAGDPSAVGARAVYTATIGGPDTPDGKQLVSVTAAGGRADGSVVIDFIPPDTFRPFGGVAAGVRAIAGHFQGDPFSFDLAAVTGPGTPLRVGVFTAGIATFSGGARALAPAFDPFGGGFTGGGFVAAADFDGDGKSEFVVTPDRGGGPRVSIFSVVDGAAVPRANFFAIDDPAFRGGARAAAGDVNGDGVPDLVVSAGFGGGPRIAVYDGKSLFGTPVKLVNDFFAFEPALRNGAFVAVGDVTGDGAGDLIFGGGPGGGPRVLVADGKQLLTIGPAAVLAAPVANFFSGPADGNRGGVRVAVRDEDGDDRADLVTGTGEGQPARVRVYPGKDLGGGPVADYDPFGGLIPADGVFVG